MIIFSDFRDPIFNSRDPETSLKKPAKMAPFFKDKRKSVHSDKGYEPLKKKRCNKYSKSGVNHRSNNLNVCKAY